MKPMSMLFAPTITGTPQDGQTLTTSAGTWNGTTPMSYAYQWNRCSSGGGCTQIGGATSSSYTATSADVGDTLTVSVTASNSAGSATAGSAPTATVGPAAVATTTSTFSGTLNKRQTSRSYSVAVGSGAAAAAVSFTKASSLTLTVKRPDGTTVGTATGASVLSLTESLAAGTYSYVVGGAKGNASFTLTLTYASP